METGLSQTWRAILSFLGAFCNCLASVLGRMDGFSVLTWMQLTYSNLVSHGHAFCFQDHLPDSRRSGFCKAALRQEIFCISQEEIWGKTEVLPALLVLFNWCGISGRLDAWGLQDYAWLKVGISEQVLKWPLGGYCKTRCPAGDSTHVGKLPYTDNTDLSFWGEIVSGQNSLAMWKCVCDRNAEWVP